MSGNNNATPILTPVAPLVDENGQITVPWRAWFSLLAQRVGGVTGFTLPSTVDVAGQIVAGVTWTSGLGQPLAVVDPTKWPTSGSIYSQTDGILGARIFVAQGNGTWLSITGV